MNNTKTSTKSPSNSNRNKKFTAESLQIVMKEYDTMKGLFSETESSTQSIFNFYITLITAVIGGIALILQFPSNTQSDFMRSQIIICGLLILAGIIGTIYILSIVYRYSRLIEYAKNLDALRLHLIREFNVPMPAIYSNFIGESDQQTSNLKAPLLWLAWLLPTGTYQLTMAFINSAAFSVATLVLRSITGITINHLYDTIFIVFVEFFFIFNLYNVYSRIALKRWTSDYKFNLNPHFKSTFRMIR